MRRALLLFLAVAAACGGATSSGSTTTTTVTGDSPVTNPRVAGTWRWGLGRGARAEGSMRLAEQDDVVHGVMILDAGGEATQVDGRVAGDRLVLARHTSHGDERLEASVDANGLSGALADQPFWALRTSDEADLDAGIAIAPPPPPPTSDAGAVIITSLPLDGGYVVGTVVPIPGEDGGVAPRADAGRVVVQHIAPPPPPPPPPRCDCSALCYCSGMPPGPDVLARQQQARVACAGQACPRCPYCPPLP